MSSLAAAPGATTYYEIRDAPGKGIGAFALQDIAAGTRILTDTALFTLPKTLSSVTPSDIRTAYQTLSTSSKAQFDALKIPAKSSDESYILTFRRNNFDRLSGTGEGGPIVAFYAHASRLNHSCAPNCVLTFTASDQQQCYAFREVKEGEELTFCYNVSLLYMTKEERKEVLDRYLGQACLCDLCSAPDPESDLRRKMLRHLMFIWLGRDLTGVSSSISGSERFRGFCKPFEEYYYMTGTFWPLYLLGKIAEMEGLPGIPTLRASYTEIIASILNVHLRVHAGKMSNKWRDVIKACYEKAKTLKMMACGENVSEHEELERRFGIVCRAVEALHTR